MLVRLPSGRHFLATGLILITEGGKEFRLYEDTKADRVRIIVPSERIMYATEQGNNNADFVELVK